MRDYRTYEGEPKVVVEETNMTEIEIQLKEVLDRVRRIETRFTKYLENQGHDTGVRRPTWEHGTITIRSLDTSLKDILALVPLSQVSVVPVLHHGTKICVITP